MWLTVTSIEDAIKPAYLSEKFTSRNKLCKYAYANNHSDTAPMWTFCSVTKTRYRLQCTLAHQTTIQCTMKRNLTK